MCWYISPLDSSLYWHGNQIDLFSKLCGLTGSCFLAITFWMSQGIKNKISKWLLSIYLGTGVMTSRSHTLFLQIIIMVILNLKNWLGIHTWEVGDMAPMGTWAHQCRYQFIDENTQWALNYLHKVQQFMKQVPWLELRKLCDRYYHLPQ